MLKCVTNKHFLRLYNVYCKNKLDIMNGKSILLSLVLMMLLSLTIVAEEKSEMIATAKQVTSEANTLFKKGQVQEAINLMENFLVDFEKLPADEKQKYAYVGGWRNLYLAAYYSSISNVDKTISCLHRAVDYGLDEDMNFYFSLRNSKVFDVVRDTPEFQAIYEPLYQKHDYLSILKKCDTYSVDSLDYTFSYQSPDNEDLRTLREYFNLDSVAGDGDELSKIKRLLGFVNNLLPHDGNTDFHENPTSVIEMTQLCISKNHGASCRSLAKLLNECYLSMGIKARYITCLPKKYISDCHVINAVWSTQLNKWLWVDPTWNAMVMECNGNYLSVQEVRYRLRNNLPLRLNDNTQLNKGEQKFDADIDDYLYNYMAKNLYYICSAKDFYAGIEYKKVESSDPIEKRWIYLVPADYDMENDDIGSGDEKSSNSLITTNDSVFWQKP